MHVLAAAISAVREVVLLFHDIKAHTALLILLQSHPLRLGAHFLGQIGVIRRGLLVLFCLLEHHFLGCFSDAAVCIDLIPIKIIRNGSIALVKNLVDLFVKVTVLPKQRILRLDPENLQQCVNTVHAMHSIIGVGPAPNLARARDLRPNCDLELLQLLILESQHRGPTLIDQKQPGRLHLRQQA